VCYVCQAALNVIPSWNVQHVSSVACSWMANVLLAVRTALSKTYLANVALVPSSIPTVLRVFPTPVCSAPTIGSSRTTLV